MTKRDRDKLDRQARRIAHWARRLGDAEEAYWAAVALDEREAYRRWQQLDFVGTRALVAEVDAAAKAKRKLRRQVRDAWRAIARWWKR